MKEITDKKNTWGRTRTDTAINDHRILSPMRLPVPPPRHTRQRPDLNRGIVILQTTALPLGYVALNKKAGNQTRTGDSNVGNVVLYQLSYTRLLNEKNISHSHFNVNEKIIYSYRFSNLLTKKHIIL